MDAALTSPFDSMVKQAHDWVLAVVARYERPLLRYSTSLVGAEQAPDVVQDTFLELCKQDRSRVEGHVAAWLFTVARNRAIDWMRRTGRGEALLGGDDMPSPDSGPQARVERHQALTRVEQIVSELPEREREAVLLKFSGGLSYREIAETMQISVSNVGFILHCAMKTIRAGLEDAIPQRRAR